MHAGITSGDSGPVAVHWNAPNGTWMQTTYSNPASPGAPTRKPSSGSAPAEASADAGQAPPTCFVCSTLYTYTCLRSFVLSCCCRGPALPWHSLLASVCRRNRDNVKFSMTQHCSMHVLCTIDLCDEHF